MFMRCWARIGSRPGMVRISYQDRFLAGTGSDFETSADNVYTFLPVNDNMNVRAFVPVTPHTGYGSSASSGQRVVSLPPDATLSMWGAAQWTVKRKDVKAELPKGFKKHRKRIGRVAELA